MLTESGSCHDKSRICITLNFVHRQQDKKANMLDSNSNTYNDIAAPMNLAFDNGNFYGLEYILDELTKEKSAPKQTPEALDWFGASDYFA